MAKTKKIIAMLLTVMMTMALAVPAFAAGLQNGSLTVNVKEGNTLKDQTIYLYKLFDVADDNGDSYTVNATYKQVLSEVLGISNESTDGQFYQNVKNVSDIQKFANDFTAKAMEQSLAATVNSGKITGNEQNYKFDNLEYGYYLVYQTGTKSLQSSLVNLTNQEPLTITLKADGQKIEKTANIETVEIGKIITYTIKGTIPDTTGYTDYVYKIYDKISDGLDFVKDMNGTALDNNNLTVTVKIDGTETTESKDSVLSEENKNMELDLSQWVKENQENKGKTFTVTYYAKANENAVVQNNNNAYLEYSNEPGKTAQTAPVEVKTPTYNLDINKIIKGTDTMLEGATFRIYRSEEDAKSDSNAIKVSGSNGKYTVAVDQNTESNTDMVTVAQKYDGAANVNLHLNGLAAGDYWVVETKAPEGYNKIVNPIKISIVKSDTDDVNGWTISKDGTIEEDKIIDVENSTGTILPGTGGIGTIIFTAVAFVLIVGVVISFIHSRRKKAK